MSNAKNEGVALKLAIKGMGLTVQQAAERIGRSRAMVQNYFKLPAIDPETKELIESKLKIKINGDAVVYNNLTESKQIGNGDAEELLKVKNQLIAEKDARIALLMDKVRVLEGGVLDTANKQISNLEQMILNMEQRLLTQIRAK